MKCTTGKVSDNFLIVIMLLQALDAVYFNAMDKNGSCFVLRLGRRHHRQTEIWLTVEIPGLGFFQYPDHPDSRVYNTNANQWK